MIPVETSEDSSVYAFDRISTRCMYMCVYVCMCTCVCMYVYVYVFMSVFHRPKSGIGKQNALMKQYFTQWHLKKNVMIIWRATNDEKV